VTASPEATALAIAAAEAASDKLAEDILAIDVSEKIVITDVFVMCSAANERQVKSVVDGVEERLHGLGAKPLRREGEAEGRWVLLDFGDIVIHVQLAEERIHYAIERLWKDCPLITLPDAVHQGRRAGDPKA
jgi:ribosome-associated protein